MPKKSGKRGKRDYKKKRTVVRDCVRTHACMCVCHLSVFFHSICGVMQELFEVLLGQGQSGNLGNMWLCVELISKCFTHSLALSQREELSSDGPT